jgi:hypothetical protein
VRTKTWRMVLGLTLLCGLGALAPAPKAHAYFICGNDFIFYYSDATHSHQVGSCTINCATDHQTCTGRMTSFTSQISACHAC